MKRNTKILSLNAGIWPLCKTFKVALIGTHKPCCAVTKNLGRTSYRNGVSSLLLN
jgi:hypothetical protein